jgi:hypothetical protein
MNIEFFGQNALVEADDNVFSFEVAENPRDLHESRSKDNDSLDWSNTIITSMIGEYFHLVLTMIFQR